MESPMAAMLDGSGGAALAGWATSPASTTTSVTTMMRAIRPIASPYSSSLATGLARPTDQPIARSNGPSAPPRPRSVRDPFDEVQLLGQPARGQVVLAH